MHIYNVHLIDDDVVKVAGDRYDMIDGYLTISDGDSTVLIVPRERLQYVEVLAPLTVVATG